MTCMAGASAEGGTGGRSDGGRARPQEASGSAGLSLLPAARAAIRLVRRRRRIVARPNRQPSVAAVPALPLAVSLAPPRDVADETAQAQPPPSAFVSSRSASAEPSARVAWHPTLMFGRTSIDLPKKSPA